MERHIELTYPNKMKHLATTSNTYRFPMNQWDLIEFDGGWELRMKPDLFVDVEAPHG